METPLTRVCRTCLQGKCLESEFHRAKNGKYGRLAHCKNCVKERQRVRLSTPEGRAQYNQYAKNHRSKPGYTAKHKTYRDRPQGKWRAYTKDAIRRGYAFEFTLERFIELFWQKPCFYCGEINLTAGVDRKDNTLGYTEDNSVPCCYTCNLMKLKTPMEDFLEKCRQISRMHEVAFVV